MRRLLSAFVMMIAISTLLTSDSEDDASRSNYRKKNRAISFDNRFLIMKHEEQMEEWRHKHVKVLEENEFKEDRTATSAYEDIAPKSKPMQLQLHRSSSSKLTKGKSQRVSSLTFVKEDSQRAPLPPTSQVELDEMRSSEMENGKKLLMAKSNYSEKPKSAQIAQPHLEKARSRKLKEPTSIEMKVTSDSIKTIPKLAVKRNGSFEDIKDETKEAANWNIDAGSQLSRSTSNSEKGRKYDVALPRRADGKPTSKGSDDLTIEQRMRKKENQWKYYNPDSSDMKLSSLLSQDSSQSRENERLDIWEERSPNQEPHPSARKHKSSRSISSMDGSTNNPEVSSQNCEIVKRVGSLKMGRKPKTPKSPGLTASKSSDSDSNNPHAIVFHPTCKNMFRYANDDFDTWVKISCSHSSKDAEERFLKKGRKCNSCVPIFCMNKQKPMNYNGTKDNAFPREYSQREVLCQILLRSDQFIKKGFNYPRKKFPTLSYLEISSKTVTITGNPHQTMIDSVRVMSCPYVLDFDHHNMYQFYVCATKSSNKYFLFLEDDDTFKVEAFITLEKMTITETKNKQIIAANKSPIIC